MSEVIHSGGRFLRDGLYFSVIFAVGYGVSSGYQEHVPAEVTRLLVTHYECLLTCIRESIANDRSSHLALDLCYSLEQELLFASHSCCAL
jgi:hypothetical protein